MKSRIIDTIFLLNRECMLERQRISIKEELSQSEFITIESMNTDEKISCNALSQRMRLSVSRVSRIVDKLVNKGYLLRHIDSKDRRAIKIYLSPKGIRCRKSIDKLKDICEKRIIAKIDRKKLGLVKKGINLLGKTLP